jgi:1,4-alpha-glucan branching enzyme
MCYTECSLETDNEVILKPTKEYHKMIMKEASPRGTVRVTFSMPAGIWADTIYLVGDFNGWDQTATPLRLTEHGWLVALDLEMGQEYQYRYLVNGTDWYNDWRADRYVPNEYGGDNSVVATTLPCEQPHDSMPRLTRRTSKARTGVLALDGRRKSKLYEAESYESQVHVGS